MTSSVSFSELARYLDCPLAFDRHQNPNQHQQLPRSPSSKRMKLVLRTLDLKLAPDVQDAERSDDGADGSASDVSSFDSHKVRINAG